MIVGFRFFPHFLCLVLLFTSAPHSLAADSLSEILIDNTEVFVGQSFEVKCVVKRSRLNKNNELKSIILHLNKSPNSTADKNTLYSYDFTTKEKQHFSYNTNLPGSRLFELVKSSQNVGIRMQVSQASCHDEGSYVCEFKFTNAIALNPKPIFINAKPLTNQLRLTYLPKKPNLPINGKLQVSCTGYSGRHRGKFDQIHWEITRDYWRPAYKPKTHISSQLSPTQTPCTWKIESFLRIDKVNVDNFYVICTKKDGDSTPNATDVKITSDEIRVYEILRPSHITLTVNARNGKQELICVVSVDPSPEIRWFHVTKTGLKSFTGTCMHYDISRLIIDGNEDVFEANVQFMCLGKQTLDREYTANKTIEFMLDKNVLAPLPSASTMEQKKRYYHVLVGISIGIGVVVFMFVFTIGFMKILDFDDPVIDDLDSDFRLALEHSRTRDLDDSLSVYPELVTPFNKILQAHHVGSDHSGQSLSGEHSV